MSDETTGKGKGEPIEQLDRLTERGEAGEIDPKERFRKTTHIALLMSYDLIDKLRYWEKESLELPADEMEPRLEHLLRSVKALREPTSSLR